MYTLSSIFTRIFVNFPKSDPIVTSFFHIIVCGVHLSTLLNFLPSPQCKLHNISLYKGTKVYSVVLVAPL